MISLGNKCKILVIQINTLLEEKRISMNFYYLEN